MNKLKHYSNLLWLFYWTRVNWLVKQVSYRFLSVAPEYTRLSAVLRCHLIFIILVVMVGQFLSVWINPLLGFFFGFLEASYAVVLADHYTRLCMDASEMLHQQTQNKHLNN